MPIPLDCALVLHSPLQKAKQPPFPNPSDPSHMKMNSLHQINKCPQNPEGQSIELHKQSSSNFSVAKSIAFPFKPWKGGLVKLAQSHRSLHRFLWLCPGRLADPCRNCQYVSSWPALCDIWSVSPSKVTMDVFPEQPFFKKSRCLSGETPDHQGAFPTGWVKSLSWQGVVPWPR